MKIGNIWCHEEGKEYSIEISFPTDDWKKPLWRGTIQVVLPTTPGGDDWKWSWSPDSGWGWDYGDLPDHLAVQVEEWLEREFIPQAEGRYVKVETYSTADSSGWLVSPGETRFRGYILALKVINDMGYTETVRIDRDEANEEQRRLIDEAVAEAEAQYRESKAPKGDYVVVLGGSAVYKGSLLGAAGFVATVNPEAGPRVVFHEGDSGRRPLTEAEKEEFYSSFCQALE